MTQAEQEYDYKKLGLRCGIEIHQQLATKGKLFCRCPNQLQGTREPEFRLIRTFRPVLGEEGKFDHAMILEFKKRSIVEYEGYHDVCCTYELDDTPPFKLDKEALDIALEISLLLNLNIVDELHICRKNYVDGSVPGGFQRTTIIGIKGSIPISDEKTVGINFLSLEEDACRRISSEGRRVTFRLDRVGTPLVEVTTAPQINDPEEARATAYRIGMLLRGTGKVKKQIGAIRQDINVSITDGERIEIKGVQKLDWIPPLVKNEVRRQIALLKIKKLMKERSITPDKIEQKYTDVTDILKNTKCKFINSGIKKGQMVWSLKMPDMKGIWGIEVQEGRRFGTEVANKINVVTGLKGLIHSDEDLKKYNLSDAEIKLIRERLGCSDNDLFVMVLGPKESLIDAIDIIIGRVILALDGVPGETRRALENGNSEFWREIHGGARLYPDTDSREIIVNKERVEEIRKSLPKYPWELIDEYSEKFNLSKEMIKDLIMTGNLTLFDKIMEEFSGKSMLVATTLIDMIKTLRRDDKVVDNLTDKHFLDVFYLLEKGKIAKEALESLLGFICDNPDSNVAEAMTKLDIKSMSGDELDKVIRKVMPQFKNLIEERGMGAMGPFMGAVMKEARGKIDGKIVSQAVKKAINSTVKGDKKDNKSPNKSKNVSPNKPQSKKSGKKSKGGKK